MNWKIIGIVVVAVFALIGVGGVVYVGYLGAQMLTPAGKARNQCMNADPEISVRGCTTMIESAK